MAFKPNYRMQRTDRERAKQRKQQKKLERQAEKVEQRKARQTEPDGTAAEDAQESGGGS
jgi:hypothetical protein